MSERTRQIWKTWFQAGAAYVLSGVVNSVLAVFIAPEFFADLKRLGKLAASSALLNVFLYLKKSPAPIVEETIITSTKETVITKAEVTTTKE